MSRVVKLSQVAIKRAIVAQSYEKYSRDSFLIRDSVRISQSCPIFQALQVHFRGRVEEVAFDTAILKDGTVYDLDDRAQKITHLSHREWGDVKPMEFTITPHPGYIAV